MLKVPNFQLPTLYHFSTAEGKPSLWADSTLPACYIYGFQIHSIEFIDSYHYEMQKTLNGPFSYDCVTDYTYDIASSLFLLLQAGCCSNSCITEIWNDQRSF